MLREYDLELREFDTEHPEFLIEMPEIEIEMPEAGELLKIKRMAHGGFLGVSTETLTEKQRAKLDLPEDLGEPLNISLPEALERLEEKMIKRALAYSNDVQSQAAEMLGISRHLMHYKMKKYGIIS